MYLFVYVLQDQELEASILSYLKFVCDEFICETAVLGVELLKRLKNPYLELDVSQFVCHTLSHIHTRKLMLTHKDRDVIKSFIQRAFVNIRYHSSSYKYVMLLDVSKFQIF